MNKPVAPYLIAIAAGDLAFRELGPRTGVWTEPAMLDARRRRARRHREDGRGGRAALRPLSLGPLRRDRAAADPSPTAAWRTRPSPSSRRPSSPATRAWSAWSRTSWRTAGRAISSPTRPGPTAGSTRASPPISRTGSWRRSTARAGPQQEAALSFDDMMEAPRRRRARTRPSPRLHLRRPRPIPTAARAASSTTRARLSCARSSGSSAASGWTPICAPISTATPSSR